jgi:GT2 family glycosyltransferase
MDDDAVADPQWLEHLVEDAHMTGYPAVGGRMVAQWQTDRPIWLPDEFLWLVGVTHENFGPDGDPDEEGPVRNTFGSNITFRREVFESLGGFGGMMGRQGDTQMQAGETELCVRMHEETGKRVWYDPDAIVEHKIPDERTELSWLIRRAWGQGRSKAQMSIGDEESSFASRLIRESVPRHISSVCGLLLLTMVVGFGWIYENLSR